MWDVIAFIRLASSLAMSHLRCMLKQTIPEGGGVDLSASGIFTFANGVTASFDCSFERQMSNSYEILGTKGSIRLPFAYRPDAPGASGTIQIKNSEGKVREETAEGEQYTLMVEHFAHSVQNNQTPSYSGEATVNNLKAIEACYESIKQNRPVELV